MRKKRETKPSRKAKLKRFQEIREALTEANEEALLTDGFEEALVGICYRYGQLPLAAYDREACLQILCRRDGMTYEESIEFFEFNVIGAWVGENTPVFLDLNPTRWM